MYTIYTQTNQRTNQPTNQYKTKENYNSQQQTELLRMRKDFCAKHQIRLVIAESESYNLNHTHEVMRDDYYCINNTNIITIW